MAFFPGFTTGEFTPLFRLLDDYATHTGSRGGSSGGGALLPAGSTSLRSFQPRFDVQETKDSYELHGELPGIDQKDVKIEFTDPQTLTISGRVERSYQRGPQDQQQQQQTDTSTSGGDQSSSYHKPTAEDETSSGMGNDAPATSAAESGAGDATGAKQDAPAGKQDSGKQVATQSQQRQVGHHAPKFWVTERSIGEFYRSFSFPTTVDQDNVKASLKNGILTITVPKAKAKTNRRINIE